MGRTDPRGGRAAADGARGGETCAYHLTFKFWPPLTRAEPTRTHAGRTARISDFNVSAFQKRSPNREQEKGEVDFRFQDFSVSNGVPKQRAGKRRGRFQISRFQRFKWGPKTESREKER